MTYEESLEYLAGLGKFGINLGLGRIQHLLELMDNPEKRFKTIHITGTNGKGSTTAMLASILQAAGIKTGMYTSPHLSQYTERMMINGCEASRKEFAEAIWYTSRFVNRMIEQGWEHPTEFEVLTAAAFYYFAAAGVEYAVIEVGLGGLLDSTNVINPELAVITNVTLEHTDRCGNTIKEIARHKAGIIKEAVPVVTAAQGEALFVIEETASKKRSNLYLLGRDFKAEAAGLNGWRQKVNIEFNEQQYGIEINLIGSHQAENCALAFMAAQIVGQNDSRVSWDAIKKGLTNAKWPGRFEIISDKPLTIIDGAHNPAGAKRLRENLDAFFSKKDIVFVLGILKDKDIRGIIDQLIRPNDKVVVAAPISHRAGEPADIAREIEATDVSIAGNLADGLRQAQDLVDLDGIICITGSLYLIGAAREILVSRQKMKC